MSRPLDQVFRTQAQNTDLARSFAFTGKISPSSATDCRTRRKRESRFRCTVSVIRSRTTQLNLCLIYFLHSPPFSSHPQVSTRWRSTGSLERSQQQEETVESASGTTRTDQS